MEQTANFSEKTSGKVLLGNWVEERSCQELPVNGAKDSDVSQRELQTQGHKGVLSIYAEGSAMENTTSCKESYLNYSPPPVNKVGARHEQLERQIRAFVIDSYNDEMATPAPAPDYMSTTHKDFGKELPAINQQPQKIEHSFGESPASFWKDQVQQCRGVTGVTQIRTQDTPFRKNSAFSTPVKDSFSQPKPYED